MLLSAGRFSELYLSTLLCPVGFGGGDAGESLPLKVDLTLFLILETEELSDSTALKTREKEGNREHSLCSPRVWEPRCHLPK